MVITRILGACAVLLLANRAWAQLDRVAPPAATTQAPAGDQPVLPGDAEKLETAPSLEQQNDLPASPEVESGATADPIVEDSTAPVVEDSTTEPAQRTEAMPNAITQEAQPAPTANAPKLKDFSWRYRFANGRWWYWMPNKSWMIWEGAQWTKYADYRARFDSRNQSSRLRGYGQSPEANGRYYNGPYSSGYRGSDSPRYDYEYRSYEPVGDGYYFGPGYGSYSPIYNYDPVYDYGPNIGTGFGGVISPYGNGTFQGGLGAGAGGGIGAAMGFGS